MASFPFILCLFQTNINKILQKINAKKCPSSAGIRTHDLRHYESRPITTRPVLLPRPILRHICWLDFFYMKYILLPRNATAYCVKRKSSVNATLLWLLCSIFQSEFQANSSRKFRHCFDTKSILFFRITSFWFYHLYF